MTKDLPVHSGKAEGTIPTFLLELLADAVRLGAAPSGGTVNLHLIDRDNDREGTISAQTDDIAAHLRRQDLIKKVQQIPEVPDNLSEDDGESL